MEFIVEDIFKNARTFLPGRPCAPDDVRAHFQGAILVDGLNQEEAALILSTLPRETDRIYLSALDKGLSGSKVFAARYEVGGRRSREFVMKIGPLEKLEREAVAMQQLAAPYIRGVVSPVFRRGPTTAAIAQELAGVGEAGSLTSLRYYSQTAKDTDKLVWHLLAERLHGWYGPAAAADAIEHQLEDLFSWYLTKAPRSNVLPPQWSKLKEWVSRETRLQWPDTARVLDGLLSARVEYPTGIIHGDLHSQNVLVDANGEVWPIDFAWCHDESSPVVDLVMLECSLKFLAIPRRSDLRILIALECLLARSATPRLRLGYVPYCQEIRNVLRGVAAIRRFALEQLRISFSSYRKALSIMTYCLTGHPQLNRPYVIASMHILLATIIKEK